MAELAGSTADAPDASPPTSASAPAERRRLSRAAKVRWIVALALALGIVAAAVAVDVAARRAFSEAAAAFEEATTDAAAARSALAEVADDADGVVARTGDVVSLAADVLVDTAARTVLADAGNRLGAEAAAAAVLLAEPEPDTPGDAPTWTWDVEPAAERLQEDAEALRNSADEMRETVASIEETTDGLVEAAVALYASAPPSAVAIEAANVSARTWSVLNFRDAASAVAAQTAMGSGAVAAFSDYAQNYAALTASNESELAEKAGPLRDTRLEIEAYARSIAGGVVLDFDWAPLVSGRGGDEWLSGTATWNTERGGYSTITLSNSIAEQWPSAATRGIVAHEVGHAITSKCSDMFDSADDAANEAWATAWAISMGHAEGNGTQAYGYPPDDLIRTAATCR